MRSVSFLNDKINYILSFALSGIIFTIITIVALIKLFYPVCYIDSINRYSEEFQLESSLVLAIVNIESGFNRFAISSRGAIGLMQLMPSTAEFIADELDIENFSINSLFNSDVNIMFGCYYLRYLSNKFDTYEKVLFAYNAGEGRLYNFLSKSGGVFNIEDIEINETKNYIKKIKKAESVYKIYHKL